MIPSSPDGLPRIPPDRWRRIEELLAAALDRPAPERAGFLESACAGDAELRAELGSLLAAHDGTGPLDRSMPRRAGYVLHPAEAEPSPGALVSHYEIEERLGSGGMGVVYRARDRRLGRTVALKFLPPALGGSAAAKARFLTEARAAAALEHPNVCTVHEIGETDEGRLFLAMAFVDGESLRDRIDRGPLPLAEALAIALQIASGLDAAHERGIVHRDVKPANVMVGRDGVVKLVDFGIAKLAGSTLTVAGATPGTAAYMSPEQARSEPVDRRTDIWSLGVVLFEMLTGSRPFHGDTDAAILHAIAASPPDRLALRRDGVPPALERIVARALEKARDRRFTSAREMRDALVRVEADVSGRSRAERAGRRRARAPFLAAAAVLALAVVATGASLWRGTRRAQALASLQRIERLSAEGSWLAAYELAERAERRLPGDTTLTRLLAAVADRITVESDPPGAEVWMRRIAGDGALAPDSTLVGSTPVRDLRVARADYRLTLRKPGYAPAERIASSAFNRAEASMGVPVGVTIRVPLLESGRAPDGMLHIPGSEYTLVGREAPSGATVTLADFYIDAFEVTNEQFREFVVAGGYDDARWWRHPFVLDGRELSRPEAMGLLVDRTGLPGPRGWIGQEFPPGEGRLPVTGVTWYEAAAYAAFAGKRLPTIFEWEKAARDGRHTHFEQIVLPWGLADPARGIARRANFGGRGPTPVDGHPTGISPWGAYDMAGNVEEWIANPAGDERFITGGAWDDPMYVFSNYAPVSAFHASPSLGFRCARDVEGATGEQGGFDLPLDQRTPEYHPVDDATFRTFLRHYTYDRGPLEPELVERVVTPDWTREAIGIRGPWNDRTLLYLYLPLRGARPFQTILFVPGSNVFNASTVPEETERIVGPHVKAGRAVLAVVLKGMRGRPWDPGRAAPTPSSVQFRQELVLHATELRRALDYLETRPELDPTRVAYASLSLGAGSRLPFAAVDPRFRSVVLIGGGIDERMQPTLPEANSVNFAPRIAAPTLLVNGRYDEEHSWYRRALPLWRLLREPKRLALLEGGHLPAAEERVPLINGWLDETLGPVSR